MSGVRVHRERRIVLPFTSEAIETRAALAVASELLEGRMFQTLQLLEDASDEYARAVAAMERIKRCRDIKHARRLAAEFIASIWR